MHYYITQEGLDFVEEGRRLRAAGLTALTCVGAACGPAGGGPGGSTTAGPPGGGSPIRTAVASTARHFARHALPKAQDVVAGGGEHQTTDPKTGKTTTAKSTTTPEDLANVAKFARGEKFTPHREPTISVAPQGFISKARQAAADVIAPDQKPSTRVVTSRGPRKGTTTEIGKGKVKVYTSKTGTTRKYHTPTRTRFVPKGSDPATRRFPGGTRASGRPSARALLDAPRPPRPGGTPMQRMMIKRGKR